MKDIKKDMKNDKEGLELRIEENKKVDFRDYHDFLHIEHCESCCCGGNI